MWEVLIQLSIVLIATWSEEPAALAMSPRLRSWESRTSNGHYEISIDQLRLILLDSTTIDPLFRLFWLH